MALKPNEIMDPIKINRIVRYQTAVTTMVLSSIIVVSEEKINSLTQQYEYLISVAVKDAMPNLFC